MGILASKGVLLLCWIEGGQLCSACFWWARYLLMPTHHRIPSDTGVRLQLHGSWVQNPNQILPLAILPSEFCSTAAQLKWETSSINTVHMSIRIIPTMQHFGHGSRPCHAGSQVRTELPELSFSGAAPIGHRPRGVLQPGTPPLGGLRPPQMSAWGCPPGYGAQGQGTEAR